MSRLATPEGTLRYARRMQPPCVPEHFRAWGPEEDRVFQFASLGLESYAGLNDEDCDRLYRDGVMQAVRGGINVIDSAINYRHMRSERALGRGLAELFEGGEASRDEIFVMSKGGYLPFDGSVPADVAGYLKETYIATGILRPEDVVDECHSMAPRFLEDQLGRSLRNFGLEALDCYFLHEPERQLQRFSQDELDARMEEAFRFLESAVEDGRIGFYGLATWNGLRVKPDAAGHLSLARIEAAARRAGGEGHHLQFLQVPYNLGMPEALTLPTQVLDGQRVSLLEAAAQLGIAVMASVPLLQAQVLPHVPPRFHDRMPGLSTSGQRALQFVRSTPGVLTALVGMKSPSNIQENCQLAAVKPLGETEFLGLLND